MKPHRSALFLLALLVMFSGIAAQKQDNPGGKKEFPSGHTVSGEFLEFYQSVNDPARVFGNPITEVLDDPIRNNIKIQYFERVRMDYDPSKPAGERVSLADLGAWLYSSTERGLPVDMAVNTPLCRHFPKNDKYVCYGFLQFYDRYNGKDLFGEPVSDAEYVNNRLVQYFEHVRMEWRNEMPMNQKVVLTEIGRIGFELWYQVQDELDMVFIPNDPITPVVRAFAAYPLLAPGGYQEINILVRDQFSQPIPDAEVQLTVIYPDQEMKVNIRVNQATNLDGLTKVSFPVNGVEPNQVIEVEARVLSASGSESVGRTWFRIWW